jgi:hypothetical protein
VATQLNSSRAVRSSEELVTWLNTTGMTTWMGDQLVAGPVPTHTHTHTHTHIHTITKEIDMYTQKFMLRMGFEPSIPTFERVQTFHTSDLAAIVIG